MTPTKTGAKGRSIYIATMLVWSGPRQSRQVLSKRGELASSVLLRVPILITYYYWVRGVAAPQTVDITESISEEKNMKTESYSHWCRFIVSSIDCIASHHVGYTSLISLLYLWPLIIHRTASILYIHVLLQLSLPHWYLIWFLSLSGSKYSTSLTCFFASCSSFHVYCSSPFWLWPHSLHLYICHRPVLLFFEPFLTRDSLPQTMHFSGTLTPLSFEAIDAVIGDIADVVFCRIVHPDDFNVPTDVATAVCRRKTCLSTINQSDVWFLFHPRADPSHYHNVWWWGYCGVVVLIPPVVLSISTAVQLLIATNIANIMSIFIPCDVGFIVISPSIQLNYDKGIGRVSVRTDWWGFFLESTGQLFCSRRYEPGKSSRVSQSSENFTILTLLLSVGATNRLARLCAFDIQHINKDLISTSGLKMLLDVL